MGLFAPAWQSKNPQKRLQSLTKLTDKDTLLRIARCDEDEVVREAALKRLKEVRLLPATGEEKERLAALTASALVPNMVLTKQQQLDAYESVQEIHRRLLPEQAELAEVARTDPDAEKRHGAVYNLIDQAALLDVARQDADQRVRTTAAERLDDQTALVELILRDNGRYLSPYRHVLANITRPEAWRDLLLGCKWRHYDEHDPLYMDMCRALDWQLPAPVWALIRPNPEERLAFEALYRYRQYTDQGYEIKKGLRLPSA